MAFTQSESLGNYAVLTEFLHLVTVTADVGSTVFTTLGLACLDICRHALHIFSEVIIFLTAVFYFLQECVILLSYVTVVVLDWLNDYSEWLISISLRMSAHVFAYTFSMLQTISIWMAENAYNAVSEIYTAASFLVKEIYPYVQSGMCNMCKRATTCCVVLYDATVLLCQYVYPVTLQIAQYTGIALANTYNNFMDSTVPLVVLVTLGAAVLVKLPSYLGQRGFTFPSIHRYNNTESNTTFADYLTDSDLDEPNDEIIMLDSDSEDEDAESNEFSEEDDDLNEQTPNSTSSEDEENDPNLINIQLPWRSGSGDNAHCARMTPLIDNMTKPLACDLERRLETERDKRLCVVCQDKLKNVLVLPCRHVCLCVDCAHVIVSGTTRQQRTCPLCRSPVETVMNVFV